MPKEIILLWICPYLLLPNLSYALWSGAAGCCLGLLQLLLRLSIWRVWFIPVWLCPSHHECLIWNTHRQQGKIGISWSQLIPCKGRYQNTFHKSVSRGKLTAVETETTTIWITVGYRSLVKWIVSWRHILWNLGEVPILVMKC